MIAVPGDTSEAVICGIIADEISITKMKIFVNLRIKFCKIILIFNLLITRLFYQGVLIFEAFDFHF